MWEVSIPVSPFRIREEQFSYKAQGRFPVTSDWAGNVTLRPVSEQEEMESPWLSPILVLPVPSEQSQGSVRKVGNGRCAPVPASL